MKQLKILTVFILILGLVSYSKESSAQQNGMTGHANQNNLEIEFSSRIIELQTKAPTKIGSLISSFAISSSPGVGGFVAFFSDSRYFSGVVQELSKQYYRIMAVSGTYNHNSDTTTETRAITTTCKSWIQAAKISSNPTTIIGTVNGSSIIISNGSITTVLPRAEIISLSPTSGVIIEWGCFDFTGRFTVESWSNITTY